MSNPDFVVEVYAPDLNFAAVYPDDWIHLIRDSSRRYCEGYLARAAEVSPRRAMRVRRTSDGVIVAQAPASDETDVGMALGYPSDAQCVKAAIKALRSAGRTRREDEPDPRIAAALAVLEVDRG